MGNACSKKPSVDKEAHNVKTQQPPSEDFRTPNPYDDRATAYNPEVQHREELIRLHESARRKQSIQGTPWDTSSNPFADVSATDENVGELLTTSKKRMPITATPLDLGETLSFRYSVIPKSPEVAKFLFEALDDNFVFDVLDDKTKRRLVDVMVAESVEEGGWVMHQGETGDYFYIVAEGSVAYFIEQDLAPDTISSTSQGIRPTSSPVGTGTKGSTFGELALIYCQARSSSVLATTPLKLYKIDQLTFRSFVMNSKVHHRDDIMALLKDVSIFRDLCEDHQLRKLADAFTLVDFEEGERIVNKGDCGSILYIVKSGEIKLHDIGHGLSKFEDQILKEGGYFGERALFEDETRGRAANVTAVTECSLLAISKKSFEEITGPIEQATMRHSRSKFLRSVPLMRQLEIDEINRCVQFLKEEQFKKDDNICTNGKLYLIQDGEALMVLHDIIKGGKEGESTLVRLKKGDYFGSIWEYDKEEEDEDNQDTVNAETDLTCLTLRTTDVESVIGDMTRISIEDESLDGDDDESAKKYHQMNGRKIEDMAQKRVLGQMGTLSIIKSQRFKPTRDKMKLRDLTKVRMLGVGTFGKVWLVTPHEKPKDGSKPKAYALKMISKRQLLQAKLVAAVLREKNVMESIQHPFLLNMVESFQDTDYLYLMLNLVLGGELFDLLYGKDKKSGKVTFANEEWTKSALYKSFGAEENVAPVEGQGVGVRAAVFYSACVIEAFSHLYNRRIVYRDLKPENVMIDSKGYCVVVDMGFAKVVRDKTYTMCGTPEYLSPEVILNMGHNHAADHWSFGCLLYELIVGRTPFYNKNSMDQINLMKRIVKADYHYPDFCSGLSPQSQGLDKVLYDWKVLTFRLLSNNSTERLGNLSGGIEDIIGHGWFGNIDFNDLRGQKLPAPWVPDVKDPLDPSSKTDGGSAQAGNKDYFATELSADDQEAFKGFS